MGRALNLNLSQEVPSSTYRVGVQYCHGRSMEACVMEMHYGDNVSPCILHRIHAGKCRCLFGKKKTLRTSHEPSVAFYAAIISHWFK